MALPPRNASRSAQQIGIELIAAGFGKPARRPRITLQDRPLHLIGDLPLRHAARVRTPSLSPTRSSADLGETAFLARMGIADVFEIA
jgi:hypothetical protein